MMEEQHEAFVKKISQWEKVSRPDWRWEHTPSHRHKFLNIVKTNQKLSNETAIDMKSLNGLEEGLEVMKCYLEESERKRSVKGKYLEKQDDLDINQCLIVKKDTREKVQKNIQQRRESKADVRAEKDFTSRQKSPPQTSKPAILDEDNEDVKPTHRIETGITFMTDVEVEEHITEKPKSSIPKETNIVVEKGPVAHRGRNIQSVESLLKLFPAKEEETARRKSVELVISKPLSRPTSSYQPIEGPSMIDRQTEWMERIEAKRRSAKIAKEKELVKELRPVPDVRVTQQSWERAKRSHAKEINKENAADMLRRQLEEMKEEMRNLRMEEKSLKQKCLLSAAKLEDNERKLRETDQCDERRVKSRGKKKKKRQERKEQSDESTGDETFKGPKHMVHVENTPVRRKETRPVSAGHQRLSRTNLHSSSASLFPELESSTSLFDVLDLVLSPSPRYPPQNSNGSKSNRREAFQVTPKTYPDPIITKHSNNRTEEDNISRDSTDPFRNKFSEDGHSEPRSQNDDDTYDDSTMISNITDRTVWRSSHPSANLPSHKDLDIYSIQRSDISDIKSISPPPTHSNRFFDASSTSDKGRYRVNDARDFDIKSMYRKVDVIHPSVTLLMGRKRNSNQEDIITVLFDRTSFTEDEAKEWWKLHRERLLFLS